MRRPGQHAVFATFRPADDQTRAVLRRGKPVSSLARFTGTDTPPASMLMDACQRVTTLSVSNFWYMPSERNNCPKAATSNWLPEMHCWDTGRSFPVPPGMNRLT